MKKTKIKFLNRVEPAFSFIEFKKRPVLTRALDKWLDREPRRDNSGNIIVPEKIKKTLELLSNPGEITAIIDGDVYILPRGNSEGYYHIYSTHPLGGNRYILKTFRQVKAPRLSIKKYYEEL